MSARTTANLWIVEDGEARPASFGAQGQGRGGVDWVLVTASTAERAVARAREYDEAVGPRWRPEDGGPLAADERIEFRVYATEEDGSARVLCPESTEAAMWASLRRERRNPANAGRHVQGQRVDMLGDVEHYGEVFN